MLIDDGLELLDEPQCFALLATNTLGRVGITMSGLPVITPVNYALVGDNIVFRTGEGSKLHAASNRAVIAFEVDYYDAESRTGWSVLAIGRAETIDESEISAFAAEELPLPAALGARVHYVRLTPELLTGRRILGG
jgi:nitroimidazol reductase NimA-like FMN-containing flavoprotein (pyridoxamine 5'-phosphate oxidase superfamily)